MAQADSYFWMDGHLARSLQEVSDDPAALEDGNFWAVSLSFEGKALFATRLVLVFAWKAVVASSRPLLGTV